MQPNYACAISGAAADSLSFKEGPWVRLLYAVINFDLGYDVESWNQGWRHEDGSQVRLKDVGFYFTSLAPLQLPLAWLFGGVRGIVTALSGERSSIHGGELWHKHTQWAKYFHLSDGGHFDNLGAYALVRRGCRFIVISDAEEDPLVDRWDSLANDDRARAFVALRELEKTLYADFGAVLEMEWDTFRVQPPEGWTSGFGNGPRSTFLVGRIRNLPVALQCGARDGDVVILYLRAAYGIDTELRRSATFLDAEKADNAEFPNDPTFPRQFFSERQVVAYRHLGRQLVLNNAREILCHFKDTRRAFSHGIRDRSGAPCPCWRKTLAEKFFGQTGSGRSALSLYSSGLQTNTIPAVATALVEVLVHGLKDILMREEEH
jgi:hypothetical protein